MSALEIRQATHFFTFFITVLIFSYPLVTIAERHSGPKTEGDLTAAQSAAEAAVADAKKDVNTSTYWWLGCFLGSCVVMPCLLVAGLSEEPVLIAAAAAAAGISAAYFYQPDPPASRLIGKSPEYVEAYTRSYKSQRGKTQALSTARGCSVLYR